VRRFEGRPAAEEVAQDRGLLLLQPLQHLRARVFEGTGQTMGQPDFVADQPPTVCDQWRQGAPGGAWRAKGGELVAGCEQEFDLECGIGGVVFRPARGQRFAVRGHGERVDGQEDKEIRCAQCGHDRPFMELQAHRHRLAVEPRAQALAPRVDDFRTVCERQTLPVRRTGGLEAAIVCGIRPVEANKGGTCFGGLWFQVQSPRV
jgi:hypothetical protein